MDINQFLMVAILILQVPAYAHDSERKSIKKGETEIVSLSLETLDEVNRQRRSSDPPTAPNKIGIKITSASDEISLYLRRQRRHVNHPKVFSATRHGYVEETSVQTTEKVFYQNDTENAALTINWNPHDGHQMYGSFIKDEQIHLLEPMRDITDQSTNRTSHVMSKVDVVVDYFRDAIVLQGKEDSPIQEDSERLYSRERRRVPTTELYVEYGIVADHKNYQMWEATIDSSVPVKERDTLTKNRMTDFYEHVVNSIDAIFKSANSNKYHFNIVFAGILIFNETNTPPWTDRHAVCPQCDIVDDYNVLKHFSDWSNQFLQNIIPHDHAALFTGFDLYYKDMESPKTIGLSFLSRMCGNWSVSVVEEKRNALTVHVAAHELGHNFGASHDGSRDAQACPASDLNLMASKMSRVDDPLKAGNPWKFSACSLNSIYEYIDKITSERRNCLRGVPHIQEKKFLQQPGLAYTADQQCQASYGKHSSVCRGPKVQLAQMSDVAHGRLVYQYTFQGINSYHYGHWEQVCYGLACWHPLLSECHVIFPHDGTPCGNKKWCQQGLCVEDENAKKTSDECPFGDDPFYKCRSSDCHATSGRHGECCLYCNQFKQTTTKTTTYATSPSPTTKLSTTKTPKSSTESTTQSITSSKLTKQPTSYATTQMYKTNSSSKSTLSASSAYTQVSTTTMKSSSLKPSSKTTVVSINPADDKNTTSNSNKENVTTSTPRTAENKLFSPKMEAMIGVYISLTVFI